MSSKGIGLNARNASPIRSVVAYRKGDLRLRRERMAFAMLLAGLGWVALSSAAAWAQSTPQSADVVTEEELTFEPSGPLAPPRIEVNCACNIFNQDCPAGFSCVTSGCTAVQAACSADPNGNAMACNGECSNKKKLFVNGISQPNGIKGGVGAGGFDGHQIQPPNNTFGNNTIVSSFHQADDFNVPTGETWQLSDGITWLYMTNATPDQLITNVYIQLWQGVPGAGGVLIAGDMVTSRLLNGAGPQFAGTYRTTEADPMNALRALKSVAFDLSWAPPLGPGNYWIEFGSTGQVASGPWLPVARPNQPGDNSRFYTVSTQVWAPNVDAGSQLPSDRPFILFGDNGGGGCTPNGCGTIKKAKCKKGAIKASGTGTVGGKIDVQVDGASKDCATVNAKGKWKSKIKGNAPGTYTVTACGGSKSVTCS